MRGGVPGWISRKHRDQVFLSGSAILSDGRELAVRVTNLSRDGCRLETSETLAIGESIQVHVELMRRLRGTVRWSLCGTSGIRFEGAGWT